MNPAPIIILDSPETNWKQVLQCSEVFQSPLSSHSSCQNTSKPKKPKRNKTAFIFFSSEMRAQFKGHPILCNMNSNEIMVKLADLWKNLKDEEKKIYEKRAQNDKARYLEELDTFLQHCPEAVIKNKTRKNHIRKPCTAYAIFLKEMKEIIKRRQPELQMAEIMKIVPELWRKLSAEHKEAYQKKSMIDKEFIKGKLCANNRVVTQGLEDKGEKRREKKKRELEEPIIKKRIKTSNENETNPVEKALIINKWSKGNSHTQQPTRIDSFNSFSLSPNRVFDDLDFDFPELDLQSCDTCLSGELFIGKEDVQKDIHIKTSKPITETLLDFISFDGFI